MKYESYQKLSIKTFFVTFLKNSFGAITITFVWVLLVYIKTLDTRSLFSFLNSEESIVLMTKIFDLAIVLGVLMIFLAWIISFLSTLIGYLTFQFMLDNHGLNIRQGLLYRKETSLPYRHIENINIDQSLLYQLLRVCNFNVLASSHDPDGNPDHLSEIEFPIIDKMLAEDIKKELLIRSNIQLVSNPVHHPTVANL